MNKKSMWQNIKSFWKAIGVISVILGLPASLLQIFGAVDFLSPLYAFLKIHIPIYYIVLFLVSCLILYLIVRRILGFRRGIPRYSNILDTLNGRKIAILCQTPRTTQFLRQRYDYWKSQSVVVVAGGYNFNDYMKRLENESYIDYTDNKWVVTQEAINYIKKYHGG